MDVVFERGQVLVVDATPVKAVDDGCVVGLRMTILLEGSWRHGWSLHEKLSGVAKTMARKIGCEDML